jgi:rhomboid protease GluP
MISLKRTPVTAALLLFIAAVLVLELRSGAFVDPLTMRRLGAITNDLFATGQYRRLLTGMFLHGSLLHWLSNSWALLQLGGLFEQMFGSWRLLLVWFTTGVVASAVSAWHLPPGGTSVGASGAIFGVMGAFLTGIPRSDRWRNHPMTKSLRAQLVFWALVNGAFGFMTPMIDNAGHIGGFLAGLMIGLLPQWDQRAATPPRD